MTSSLRRTSVLVKHKSKQLGLNTKCALNMPSATFKRSWDRDWLFQGSKKKNYMERNRTCVFRLARYLKHIIHTSCLQYKLLNTPTSCKWRLSKNLNIPTASDFAFKVSKPSSTLNKLVAASEMHSSLFTPMDGQAFDLGRKSDQTKGITRVLHHRIDHSILKYSYSWKPAWVGISGYYPFLKYPRAIPSIALMCPPLLFSISTMFSCILSSTRSRRCFPDLLGDTTSPFL